jgi:hypothetical protein
MAIQGSSMGAEPKYEAVFRSDCRLVDISASCTVNNPVPGRSQLPAYGREEVDQYCSTNKRWLPMRPDSICRLLTAVSLTKVLILWYVGCMHGQLGVFPQPYMSDWA